MIRAPRATLELYVIRCRPEHSLVGVGVGDIPTTTSGRAQRESAGCAAATVTLPEPPPLLPSPKTSSLQPPAASSISLTATRSPSLSFALVRLGTYNVVGSRAPRTHFLPALDLRIQSTFPSINPPLVFRRRRRRLGHLSSIIDTFNPKPHQCIEQQEKDEVAECCPTAKKEWRPRPLFRPRSLPWLERRRACDNDSEPRSAR